MLSQPISKQVGELLEGIRISRQTARLNCFELHGRQAGRQALYVTLLKDRHSKHVSKGPQSMLGGHCHNDRQWCFTDELRIIYDRLLCVCRHRVEHYDRFEVAPNHRVGNRAVSLESSNQQQEDKPVHETITSYFICGILITPLSYLNGTNMADSLSS